MQNIDDLKKKFASDNIHFQETNGIIITEIKTEKCSASISLQGAHLMTWKPSGETHPVVWLSEDAKIAPGKSIRGGVPVCWPWFGPHRSESKFPAHGFARAVPWELLEASKKGDNVHMKFRLINSDSFQNQWPHPSTLELAFEIGNTLKVELTTANTGDKEFTIGEALHTYFQIGDIEKISVEGLDKTEYLDKVGEHTKRMQSGSINFSSEVDRVFMNTPAECTIVDSVLGRKIKIKKSESMSTIVWTPWKEKADQMGDMGKNEGWRRMVCVETGNALENCVSIPAGNKHTVTAIYSAEKI